MQPISREFSQTFAHCEVKSTIFLEGPGVESQLGMLDKIFAQFSMGVHNNLIPHINGVVKKLSLPRGDTSVNEVVKLELSKHVLTLTIEVNFYVDFADATPEAMSFLVVEMLAPDVIATAAELIPQRQKEDLVQAHLRKEFGGRRPFFDCSNPDGAFGGVAFSIPGLGLFGPNFGVLADDFAGGVHL